MEFYADGAWDPLAVVEVDEQSCKVQ